MHLLSSSQCLKAEDIASTVTYVLSAPPHVEVKISAEFTLRLLCVVCTVILIELLLCAVRSGMCRCGPSSRCHSNKTGCNLGRGGRTAATATP